MSDTLLAAVLDRLLPGDADWPAAGRLGLAAAVRGFAAGGPDDGAGASRVLADLPADFETLAGEERDAALATRERDDPAGFEALINAAYTIYYTDPRVLAVVERLTGYAARPPQPLGHELPPFDERLLDRVKQRQPFWRRVD